MSAGNTGQTAKYLYQREKRRNTMKPSINIQDTFLNQLRKEGIFVTVFLISGFQLKGKVKGFDNFTILLDSDGKQQLIFKHAISTFAPSKPVNLNSSGQDES
jgi:host factor-I protein